jgi:hypothetical protein
MKTVLTVVLKIEVNHDAPLDENSVKSVVSKGKNTILRNRRHLSTIEDQPIESVRVSVTEFRENGKRKALSLYGTDSVSFND